MRKGHIFSIRLPLALGVGFCLMLLASGDATSAQTLSTAKAITLRSNDNSVITTQVIRVKKPGGEGGIVEAKLLGP